MPLLGRGGIGIVTVAACLVSAAWLTPRPAAPDWLCESVPPNDAGPAKENPLGAGADRSLGIGFGSPEGLLEAKRYLDEQIVEIARRFQRMPFDNRGTTAAAVQSRHDPVRVRTSPSLASTAGAREGGSKPATTPASRRTKGAPPGAGDQKAVFSSFGEMKNRPPAPAAAVFQLGPSSLPAQNSSGRAAWTRVPEDTTPALGGDGILANDRMAVVFRRGESGAEVYGLAGASGQRRAVLIPQTETEARLQSLELVENSADQCVLDTVFRTPDGQEAAIRFELQAGQAFVKTTGLRGVTRLRIEAPCRFAVLPDFFGDDLVFDAESLAVDQAALPSENFLMHMVGSGDAVVLAIWTHRDEDVQVFVADRGGARGIEASQIAYGAEGVVFVAVLEGQGIWHRYDVSAADAGRTIGLDWKAPFPAQWRVDWRDRDGLTASWQMWAEAADGSYGKADWFGRPEEDGTPEWLKSSRKGWTPRLGSYHYPCWIDRSGRGWLQPLAQGPVGFQGPALVYPLHRVVATPLDGLTLVDVMRATLGVGPCDYVLDVEAQRGKMRGVPTCVTRQKLMDIYGKKEQKKRRAEVERALDDVQVFLRHIRMRIDTYGVFGQHMLAYLEDQKKTRPELSGFVEEMETLAQRITAAIEEHRIGIHTPEYVTGAVEEFRATLLDYEGDDASYRCSRINAMLTEIGGNQDTVVCQCREAVKVLRARAALAMAADPRTAPVAEEIRQLTYAMLRNPTSFEAPRY